MDRFQRIYKLHKILANRRTCISLQYLAKELERSEATIYRDLVEFKNTLNAPIINIRGQGYRYDPKGQDCYELPGLWFNPSEIQALLTFHALLQNIQPGLLDAEIKPLRNRIEKILQNKITGGNEIQNRIRIIAIANRPIGDAFQTCANALIDRKQLKIQYHSRSHDETTTRTLSPQRLTHYRDNWYLDAWCHKRQALRIFTIDRISQPKPLDTSAINIDEATLDEHFASSFGIFSGKPTDIAVLIFNQHAARWVADEQWHPKQTGQQLPDGRYQLEIPYNNPKELGMDILRYAEEVEVIAPTSLRQYICQRLQETLKKYQTLSPNESIT